MIDEPNVIRMVNAPKNTFNDTTIPYRKLIINSN